MFVPLPLLIVAAVVTVVLLFLALRPRGRSNDLIAPPRMPMASAPRRTPVAARPTPGLAPDIEAQVRELLRGDQVIMAVKIVRESTGLGLKEAKDIVDAMRQSGPSQR